jgi:carboxypeptidase Q
MKSIRILTSFALTLAATGAALAAEEPVDLAAIHQIRTEALENSKVMEHVFYLADVYGPRLSNSTNYFKAADWAVKQLREWGINAETEKWGPFGRGWEFTRYSGAMVEPQYSPLIGVPLAYTPGTNGPATAEVTIVVINSDADFDKYKGKIRGKMVLLGPGRDLQLSLNPLAMRRSDSDLITLSLAPEPPPVAGPKPPGSIAAAGGRGGGRGGPGNGNGGPQAQQFQQRLNKFLADEGVLVALRPGGGRSEGGTVFAQGGGSRELKDPIPPPMVALTPEHYNRIARLLDHNIPVKLEFDIRTRFIDDRTDSVNVIGQIDGVRKKDEIVMVGAHLDSWQGGTGATDNAAGSAVMLEVMRILKTLNLRLDRSVRIGLWGGEEQGLLGSRAYVTEHFAAREDMKLKPDHAKFSGYFNVDNGSGKIRGVYMQGNDMMRPIFESWLAPFRDLGAATVSVRNTGGTDHQSFDAVGLPGFQFIQDQLEYDSRTHHSNMDVYDRLQRGDLAQMAAIVASFVYQAANREALLPRKALPKPQPPPRQNGNGAATGGGGAN